MNAEIQKLAAMTGQSEADVTRFLTCVSVWTAKGYSFEQAIAKNLETVQRIADNAHLIPRSIAVDAFFPA
jgi:hypothetical protein